MKQVFEDIAYFIWDLFAALLAVAATIIAGITFISLMALPVLGVLKLLGKI